MANEPKCTEKTLFLAGWGRCIHLGAFCEVPNLLRSSYSEKVGNARRKYGFGMIWIHRQYPDEHCRMFFRCGWLLRLRSHRYFLEFARDCADVPGWWLSKTWAPDRWLSGQLLSFLSEKRLTTRLTQRVSEHSQFGHPAHRWPGVGRNGKFHTIASFTKHGPGVEPGVWGQPTKYARWMTRRRCANVLLGLPLLTAVSAHLFSECKSQSSRLPMRAGEALSSLRI